MSATSLREGRQPPAALEGPRVAPRRIPRRVRALPVLFFSRDFLIDALMLVLAALVSVVSAPAAGVSTDIVAFLVFDVAVLLVLTNSGLYRATFASHFLDDARKVVGATAIVAMAMTFTRVLIFDNPQAAEQAARAWVFAATYIIAARAGVHLVEMGRLRAGSGGEPTLIVGAGSVGRQFAARLVERPEFGLKPVAFLDDDPLEFEDDDATIPVLHSGADPKDGDARFGPELEGIISDHGISNVVVSFSASSHQAELDLVRRCQALGVAVSVLPRLFEGVTDQLDLERIGGIPMISMNPSNPLGWQYAVKYASDRVLAVVVLILASPIFLVAGIATLISAGRPIFFRQRRVGLNGNEFDLLKFRTMRPAADPTAATDALEGRFASGLAPGGVEGEDRRTRVGAVLRKTSIDELPQLINVIRGDMSLVGPRPERPTFAKLFDESVYRYADRHRVKSGITGWSQVNGLRGSTSIRDRVEWDNYYIENRSLWLDLKIVALTIPALLRDRAE
jgi:exopolysaccharide biosynthesis polyprenyl glycosylphosphotransferase